MNANIPNFWSLVSGNYDSLGKFAIILTICILGIGAYLILSRQKELSLSEDYLNFACWVVWTCVLFLPVMHDRYAYGLDILLLILCFINKIYIPFAIASEILSLLSYNYFLFDVAYMERLAAIIYISIYLIYTCIIYLPKKEQ